MAINIPCESVAVSVSEIIVLSTLPVFLSIAAMDQDFIWIHVRASTRCWVVDLLQRLILWILECFTAGTPNLEGSCIANEACFGRPFTDTDSALNWSCLATNRAVGAVWTLVAQVLHPIDVAVYHKHFALRIYLKIAELLPALQLPAIIVLDFSCIGLFLHFGCDFRYEILRHSDGRCYLLGLVQRLSYWPAVRLHDLIIIVVGLGHRWVFVDWCSCYALSVVDGVRVCCWHNNRFDRALRFFYSINDLLGICRRDKCAQ